MTRQELTEQIVAQQALVQALREYSRLAYLQYNGGYAPYTDVLQAEQQLFPAELNLAAAQTALLASVVRIYQATGGGWVDLAQKTADAPPQANGKASSAAPGNAADRIEVAMEGETSVVNVYHAQGSGGAELRAPTSGWPPKVVVRLRGFTSLASFSAESADGRLTCSAAKGDAKAEPVCQLGSARINAISKRPEYTEVVLPSLLLKPGGGPVEVRWAEHP